MKIDYNSWYSRQYMVHSELQVREAMIRMDHDDKEATNELIKKGESIGTIYIPQEFDERLDFIFHDFELIEGFIVKLYASDEYLDDEESRGKFDETYLDITSVKNGEEDKHFKLDLHSVPNEGFVYYGPYTITVPCFFSGIISYYMKHKGPFTAKDYIEWKNGNVCHTYLFYHHEYGFTEEQLAFLFKFGEQDLRPVMIHDIAQIVHKRWDEYPEDKYYRIDRMFMGVIRAEILCEFQDYFLLTSEFRKEIFETKLNELKDHIEYSKKHVRNYHPEKDEQAVAFLEECLKRYKE